MMRRNLWTGIVTIMVELLGSLGRAAAIATVMLVALLGGSASASDSQGGSDYRLGSEDKLKIKVYDWRKDTGEAHEWTALTGEFTVSASGSVFLPLVGEIAAARRTPSDVAHDISSQLQRRFGLAEQPDASVEIVEYRPFYIIGIVEKAGAYPYRPGMTVLQAVGVAGGVSRLRDASVLGYERDAVAARGDLRMLSAQRLGLLARQARFDAEINGADSVSYPGELLSLKAEPTVAKAMREEELLFQSTRDSLAKQIDSLNRTTDLLQHEITALGAKDVSLSHQMDLARKELDTVATLVTKGLTIVPRQLALEQSMSQYDSTRLDIQLSSLRAKQDMARVEREILGLRTAQQQAALTESREVRSKITATNAQIETAQGLLYQSEIRAPQVIAAARANEQTSLVYRITRNVDGVATTQDVVDNDRVQPGDTISVDQRRGREIASEGR